MSKQNNSSLPDNWATIPLKDITSKIVDGSHNPPRKQDSGMPMLSARNINNNQINFDNYRLISEKDFENEHNRTRITPGDVLLTIVGTIGRSAIVPDGIKPFTLQRSVAVLTFKDIVPKYMMYQLQSPFFQRHFNKVAKGTAQKGVYLRTLGQSIVRVAPLNEQKSIVAELEKQFSRLDEAVDNLKRVKANLKRYKASVLKAAVEGKLTEEWRTKNKDVEPADKLLERILAERRKKWEEAELAKMRAKGKVPRDDKWKKKYKEPVIPNTTDLPDLPEGWVWVLNDTISFVTKLAGFEYTKFVKYDDVGDLAVIKAENAGKDGFKRTDFSKVKSESVSHLTRSQLVPGDLLMVFVGAGTGNVARVPDDQPYFLGPNIGMIRVGSQFVLPEYLELFLRSPIGNGLSLGFVKAVAQPSLSMGTIRKIPIAAPPISEQKVIVTEIERLLSNIDETEIVVVANLQRAERLRQSILKKAFSGELVRHTSDANLAKVSKNGQMTKLRLAEG